MPNQQLSPNIQHDFVRQLLIWNALTPEARNDHRRTGEQHLVTTIPDGAGIPPAVEPTTGAEDQDLPGESHTVPDRTEPAGERRSPFSLKGVMVGAAMSLVVSVAATYGDFIIRGSRMALNSTAPIAIFFFF